MKSRNLYFVGPEQVELREEETAKPGPGQVLIRARRSLISTGTELICYARKFDEGTHWDQWVKYPFPPGYSHVGTVVEVGEGVTGLEQGARVATSLPHHEYGIASAAWTVPVPDAVSDDDAAWFTVASITQNAVRLAEHVLGETVVVIGLGVLGQLVTQYASVNGASEVIAIDLSPTRLQMARTHGATHTLQMPVEDAASEVKRITAGRGADCVYDVTGFAAVFPHALGLARTLGKVVLLGDTGAPAQQHLSSDLIRRSLRVIGAHGSNTPRTATDYAWWTSANMQRLFFHYVETGRMRVSDLVTACRRPEDAPEVYAGLLHDRTDAMGVIFDWTA